MRQQGHHFLVVSRAELAEGGVDGGLERGVVGEDFVGQGFLFRELPDPFDQVQVRGVRRQVDQVDAGVGRDAPHDRGGLVAGVVQDHADRPVGVGVANLQEQSADGDSIDGAVGGFANERAGDGVQRSQNAVALPAGPGGDDPADEAPEVAEEGPADEVDGIDEDHAPLFVDGLFRERLQGFIVELLLDDGVRLGRNAAGFAVAEPEFFKKRRTWVSPRRTPVLASMTARASATVAGGCVRKCSSRVGACSWSTLGRPR